MRKTILPIVFILLVFTLQAQVGIGTTTPQARLHVTDSSVLFSAPGAVPATAGNPPISGAGRRMMWYPGKAAFRVGFVENNHWDRDSIGVFSFASGANTKATGGAAVAMGLSSISSGSGSISLGNQTEATGTGAVAMGVASTASAGFATALGYQTTASAGHSTALGANSIASAWYSTALGRHTIAPSGYETVIGKFNTEYTPLSTNGHNNADRLFTIGNGLDINNRSDALVMLKNGNTGLGNSLPQVKLHIEGGTAVSGSSGGHLQLGPGDGQNLAFDQNEIQSRNDGVASNLLLQARGGNVVVGGKVTRTATGTNDLLPVAFGKVFGDGTIHTGTGNFTITKTGAGTFDLAVSGVSPASATLILVPKGDVTFIRTMTYQTDANVFKIYSYRMNVVFNSSLDVTNVQAVGYDGDFNFVVYYF
jgi:hypothetical protein